MTIKSGLTSEFLRKMSSGLLSGCLQNQIYLLAPKIEKIFRLWVGLGWVCTYDLLGCLFFDVFDVDLQLEVSNH
jgi:hypothetical protein